MNSALVDMKVDYAWKMEPIAFKSFCNSVPFWLNEWLQWQRLGFQTSL